MAGADRRTGRLHQGFPPQQGGAQGPFQDRGTGRAGHHRRHDDVRVAGDRRPRQSRTARTDRLHERGRLRARNRTPQRGPQLRKPQDHPDDHSLHQRQRIRLRLAHGRQYDDDVAALRAGRHLRGDGRVERRQPHRRTRRTGHGSLGADRGGAGRTGLSLRTYRIRRLPQYHVHP